MAMDSKILPPPPQHPSSSRSLPMRSPGPGGAVPPAMPPRPSYYVSQENSGSSSQMRPPIPARHPSHSRPSTDSAYSLPAAELPPLYPTGPTPSASNVSLESPTPSSSNSDPEVTEVSQEEVIMTPVVISTLADIPRPDRSQTIESAFERTLSERELRDLYNDEEIDRFLRLFSAHVTEVKLQDSSEHSPRLSDSDTGVVFESVDDEAEGGWTSVNESTSSLVPPKVFTPQNLSLSEKIAFNYILPLLPPAPPPAPSFTLGRLKSTTQRLFLALEPGYKFFISKLVHLAIWKDKPLSMRYCFGFWVLWLYNLLLPALLLYLLWTLVYRKAHPYPTLEELREHRDRIDKAKEFGEELQMRLTTSPAFGVKEAWRVFRVFNKSRKQPQVVGKAKSNGADVSLEDLGEPTVLDDPRETKKESDLKGLALAELTELTDSIERIKNLFLWRRPTASFAFGLGLATMFLITLILPARYLAKLVYFVIGVIFWHVPPVILAIPADDRKRLISILHQVPTDADYAMELIAQRIAVGQEIKPLKRRLRKETPSLRSGSVDSSDAFVEDQGPKKPKTKLKKGIGMMTALAAEGAKMVTGEPFLHRAFAPDAAREATGDSRTYPAQYGKTPGVISITSTSFFFTTLMSSHAKVIVPLDEITGIKKGFSKAISLQLKDNGSGPRVERFMWVYERDDLFARLVGLGGRKWTNV